MKEMPNSSLYINSSKRLRMDQTRIPHFVLVSGSESTKTWIIMTDNSKVICHNSTNTKTRKQIIY